MRGILFLILIASFTMPVAAKSTTARAKTAGKFAKSDLPKYLAAYKIESLAPNLHFFQVSITVQNVERKPEIDFILPAWRPGRYQIQNYAAMCKSSVPERVQSRFSQRK
jgi:hypothetical protein